MIDKKLEALVGLAESMARDGIADAGRVPPMVLCQRHDGNSFIIGYETAPTAMQRRFQALQLGGQMREMDVARFVAMHESWVCEYTPGETWVPPSKRSDRREVVFLEGHGADERVFRCYQIERDGAGVELVSMDMDGATPHPGGTWDGLLQPR